MSCLNVVRLSMKNYFLSQASKSSGQLVNSSLKLMAVVI
jgi:hypothetical protein